MSRIFDSQHVRRAFSRAAAGYDEASAVQREIETRLLDSLDYYALRHGQATPARILDLACGPARAANAMRQRWPKAEIIAADIALPMLHAARDNTRGHWLRQREIARKGGASVPSEKRSFSQDRSLAAQAGRKGGEASHGARSKADTDDTPPKR